MSRRYNGSLPEHWRATVAYLSIPRHHAFARPPNLHESFSFFKYLVYWYTKTIVLPHALDVSLRVRVGISWSVWCSPFAAIFWLRLHIEY